MIKKLEPEDIAKLLIINDPNVEKALPCDKGTLMQWMMDNSANERILIIGEVQEEKLLSYCVVVDNNAPPISNSACILYMSESAIGDQDIKDYIIQWAKERNITSVIFQCGDEATLSRMEGEKIGIIGVWGI